MIFIYKNHTPSVLVNVVLKLLSYMTNNKKLIVFSFCSSFKLSRIISLNTSCCTQLCQTLFHRVESGAETSIGAWWLCQ